MNRTLETHSGNTILISEKLENSEILSQFVDFAAADICRSNLATTKARNFKGDMPSLLVDMFRDYFVIVFDFTSMQDATENCPQPEEIEKTLTLELNFTFPLEQV